MIKKVVKEKVGDKYSEVRDRSVREREREKDEDMVEATKRDGEIEERERKRREPERREDREIELDTKSWEKYNNDVRCREKYRNWYRVSRRFTDVATRQQEKNMSKPESEEKESNRVRKKTQQQQREDRQRERQMGERMIREQHEMDDTKTENDRKEKEKDHQRSNSEDICSPKKIKVEEEEEEEEEYMKRNNSYVEVNEISKMNSEEVFTYRKQLHIRLLFGRNFPKPIYTWHQSGLSTTILDTLKTLNLDKPMPIQAQALPIIMSGRDCIGVAKPGSGKTLAFVLPMLRHIKDQSPLVSGDGPIGLVIAPTTELVQQIHSDISKFIKPLGLTCVPFCGGTQINELNRGAEIVVCTPDRMMNLLPSSDGKITDLRRVTYLVMDETDWMLDMGFHWEITRICQNTHPNRQTVLFSATFGRGVERLAQKVSINPVGIQIGCRSLVDEDVTQLVEVRPVDQRFMRLLELLGEWYEKGNILIFVDSQVKCTTLFKDLLGQGYPCLSLHDEEQKDRESIVSEFKSNVCKLLVVTSTAARGLGVKDLKLVINYDVPFYYEHYVHHVGRAGRKGCAITFISEDDARNAHSLVLALKLSNQLVPDELKALDDDYGEEEEEARKAKEYVFEEDKSHSEYENAGVRNTGENSTSASSLLPKGGVASAAAMNLVKIEEDAMAEHYEDELEINQCPENARCWVTDKKIVGPISKWTGATITIRGQYYPPGKIVGPLDRKLYLFIEGPTENSVTTTKLGLMYALQDFMLGLLRPNC